MCCIHWRTVLARMWPVALHYLHEVTLHQFIKINFTFLLFLYLYGSSILAIVTLNLNFLLCLPGFRDSENAMRVGSFLVSLLQILFFWVYVTKCQWALFKAEKRLHEMRQQCRIFKLLFATEIAQISLKISLNELIWHNL